MATRGLISSLFVGIWIAFLLADCSSFPRNTYSKVGTSARGRGAGAIPRCAVAAPVAVPLRVFGTRQVTV
jgi:hypothetical protein